MWIESYEFINFEFTIEELMNVAKLMNNDYYEDMSTQELENIFAMLSASISTLITVTTILDKIFGTK